MSGETAHADIYICSSLTRYVSAGALSGILIITGESS